MGSSSLRLTVDTYISIEETLTNQLTDNSQDLRLTQKHVSSETDQVRAEYAVEEDRIRNEIEGLDKIAQKNEYQDLLGELNDLKEEKESKIESLENQTNDDETKVQSENEIIEVQLEDVKAQRESFQEMLKECIENESGYFQ